MLEHLFGSDARAKIIKFFCTNFDDEFYLRELARKLDLTVNSISRELNNLERLGLLTSTTLKGKKYYRANKEWSLFTELRALIVKSTVLLEKVLIRQLKSLSGVKVLLLTGIFVNQPVETDIVLIGSVSKIKVQKLITTLSKSFYQDLRFTILTTAEYKYRMEVTDKFLYTILNLSPIIIIDKFGK